MYLGGGGCGVWGVGQISVLTFTSLLRLSFTFFPPAPDPTWSSQLLRGRRADSIWCFLRHYPLIPGAFLFPNFRTIPSLPLPLAATPQMIVLVIYIPHRFLSSFNHAQPLHATASCAVLRKQLLDRMRTGDQIEVGSNNCGFRLGKMKIFPVF